MPEKIENTGKSESPQNVDWNAELVKETRELSRWTKKLFIATFSVVIVTVFVVIVGQEQACDSREQVGISGDAAQKQWLSDTTQIVLSRNAAIKQDAFTRATLDSTGAQLNLAREAMRKQLRAYVSVEIDTGIGTPIDYIRTFRIRNTGQTPAYNLRFSVQSQAAYFKPRIELHPIDTVDKSRMNLNPGQSLPTASPPLYMDAITARAVMDSTAAIFTLGKIYYEDAFGNHRHVYFKYGFVVSKASNRSFTLTWPEGNEAD